MAEHNELGKKGESAAAEFLRNNGYEILALNYTYGKGEIDIICKIRDMIVFCEVKTRSTDYFGFPEESVDRKKIRKLKRTAEQYLFQNNLDTMVRFDIISIISQKETQKIYHIKDAFFQEDEDADDIYH